MNIKKENKLSLNSLINHRIQICDTEHPASYTAIKESVLNVLDGLIKKRTKILNKIA